MGTLSTHVLDTGTGQPARGVTVQLTAVPGGEPLGEGVTDGDGRVTTIGPERLPAGDFRLRFDTGAYFAAAGTAAFYPEVLITFTVADADAHYHVPVLLSPFGYATYRGS